MLRKNKIFLELLGSFYENTAYTDFSIRIDYVYTSIIFNRYVNTIRNMVLSHPSSKGRGVVGLGYIKSSEINPSTNSIIVRDVNGRKVEGIGYLSLDFLDIEKFYRIDGNTIDSELMSSISALGHQVTPITYMKDVPTEIFRNGYFRFVDDIDSADIVEIKKAILRIVSDHAAYMPSSTRMLYKISNILLGCVYAKDFEDVISVSSDMVVTTKNTYYLNGVNSGRAIVSIGDSLSPSDIITSLCSITDDMAFLDEIRRAEAYINSISPSFSNTNFLYRISSSVAKKKVSIEIPPDVFAETDTEVVSAMNSMFSVVSFIDSTPSSGVHYESLAYADSDSMLLLSSNYVANITIKSGWILDIAYEAAGDIIENESLLVSDNSVPYVDFDMILSAEPVIDGMNASPNETISNIIVDSVETLIPEDENLEGLYIDTNIAEPIDNETTLVADKYEYYADDGGATFHELTVQNYDNFNFDEASTKHISASDIVVASLSGIVEHVLSQVDFVNQSDVLLSNTTVSDFSVGNAESIAASMLVSESEINVSEGGENNTTINVGDTLSMLDSVTSDGFLSRKDSLIIDASEDISSLLLAVKDVVFMDDVSDIEGENRIDS